MKTYNLGLNLAQKDIGGGKGGGFRYKTYSFLFVAMMCEIDAGFELADRESRIAVHFKIFVDQFCLFFIKFAVQNTFIVQIRDQSFLKIILFKIEIKKNPMQTLSLQPIKAVL